MESISYETSFIELSFFDSFLQKIIILPSDERKIIIKLEIDTIPPEGSGYESRFLTYPYPFSLLIQDLPSLFATKCHAILCRKYEKGKDWFDFLWYLFEERKFVENWSKELFHSQIEKIEFVLDKS